MNWNGNVIGAPHWWVQHQLFSLDFRSFFTESWVLPLQKALHEMQFLGLKMTWSQGSIHKSKNDLTYPSLQKSDVTRAKVKKSTILHSMSMYRLKPIPIVSTTVTFIESIPIEWWATLERTQPGRCRDTLHGFYSMAHYVEFWFYTIFSNSSLHECSDDPINCSCFFASYDDWRNSALCQW